MAQIFISYSTEDKEFVDHLYGLLQKEGFDIWMDRIRIDPGVTWSDAIEQGIKQCCAFIVVMSPTSRESEWVGREVEIAKAEKKTIYPVHLKGEIWTNLKHIEAVDMSAGLLAVLPPQFVRSLRKQCSPDSIVPGNVTLPVDKPQKPGAEKFRFSGIARFLASHRTLAVGIIIVLAVFLLIMSGINSIFPPTATLSPIPAPTSLSDAIPTLGPTDQKMTDTATPTGLNATPDVLGTAHHRMTDTARIEKLAATVTLAR